MWTRSKDELLNSLTESTLDPPYGEIQEISTLSSWFTYEIYKIERWSNQLIQWIKCANLTISILREMMQVL